MSLDEQITMPAWWHFCLAAVGLLFIGLAAAGYEKDALLAGFALASSVAGVVLARLIKGPQDQ
jgi:hypothetical protein